jgi:hypothetical protein
VGSALFYLYRSIHKLRMSQQANACFVGSGAIPPTEILGIDRL